MADSMGKGDHSEHPSKYARGIERVLMAIIEDTEWPRYLRPVCMNMYKLGADALEISITTHTPYEVVKTWIKELIMEWEFINGT